jgi:hypothetical protein
LEIPVVVPTMEEPAMAQSRAVAFAVKEFEEMLPPIIFFAIGFNLIELTTQLVLDDYFVRFANYLVATMAALIIGKAVLLANLMPLIRRYDNAPLIQPILFKTIVYSIVVFLVRVLEKLIEYLVHGGKLSGIPDYVAEHFTWHMFAAVQIWIFVLFLIYTTLTDVDARLGRGALARMLFHERPSRSKP